MSHVSSRLSVAKLQAICEERKLKQTGKKNILLDRIILDGILRSFASVSTQNLVARCRELDSGTRGPRPDLLCAMVAHCFSLSLDTVSAVDLRDMCRENKLPVSGTKIELKTRYSTHKAQYHMYDYIDKDHYDVLMGEPVIAGAPATAETRASSTPEQKVAYPEGLSEGITILVDKELYSLCDGKKCRYTAYGYALAGSPAYTTVDAALVLGLARGDDIAG